MTPLTLSQIVAEGELLLRVHEAAMAPHQRIGARAETMRALGAYCDIHGPRLLAAARAGMEMRRRYGKLTSLHSVESGVPTWGMDDDGELVQTGRTPDIDKPDCEHCHVLAAWDAVAGGGEEKT
jgi:hypothetical protein